MNERLRLSHVYGFASFLSFLLLSLLIVILSAGGLAALFLLGLSETEPYLYLVYACLFLGILFLLWSVVLFAKGFARLSPFLGTEGDIVEALVLEREEAEKELYEAGRQYASYQVPDIPLLLKLGRDRLVLAGNVLSPFLNKKKLAPGTKLYVYYSPLKISRGVVIYRRGAFSRH